ncbi:MAG: family metalloprotease protein [Firmicutes bacterium]|nr:family metalloprotease protein [Bacillota bacterium]
MKKVRATILVSILMSTLVLPTGLVRGEQPNQGNLRSESLYHAVSIPEEVQAKLRAEGLEVKEHVPANLMKGPHSVNMGEASGIKPIAAEQKAIAIYMKFPNNPNNLADVPPAKVAYEHTPLSLLQNLLFGDSYNPYTMEQFAGYATYNGVQAPLDRTLKNYYNGVSDGKVTVTGQLVEVTLPHPYSYYKIGEKYGNVDNTNGDYTMALLFEDAVKAADAQVDFSKYAINGVVPNIFLIHQGTGAEFSTEPKVIWSHSWNFAEASWYNHYALTGEELLDLPNDGLEVDSVKVNNYSVEPEVGGDITGFLGTPTGPYPPHVGVYAHEFGHVLGLPDQYDYGYDSKGTGAYTLMASGSWTRYPNAPVYGGNSPVMLDAWSKVYLGLTEPQVLTTGSETVTLKPSSEGGNVVKLVVPGSNGNEYFLLENRQQVGFDSSFIRYGTGVHGLAIFHIDENVLARNFDRPNEAANWFQSRKQAGTPDPLTGETHYAISLLQADNKWDLEKNVNVADGGDLYKAGQTFTPTSVPNSGSYYFAGTKASVPNNTGIYVEGIVENKDGSVTFTAGFNK